MVSEQLQKGSSINLMRKSFQLIHVEPHYGLNLVKIVAQQPGYGMPAIYALCSCCENPGEQIDNKSLFLKESSPL